MCFFILSTNHPKVTTNRPFPQKNWMDEVVNKEIPALSYSYAKGSFELQFFSIYYYSITMKVATTDSKKTKVICIRLNAIIMRSLNARKQAKKRRKYSIR